MVFGGDFKVALVDAQTKQPFPEHYRDGQAYIEVEPDVEYYISLQRIQSSLGGVIVTCKVDGKDLGWQRNYQFNQIDTQPHYNGSSSFSYSNADPTGYYRKQEEKRTALVFEKVKIRMSSNSLGGEEGEAATSITATATATATTSTTTTVVPMGKVEFNVFQMGNPFTLMGYENLFISDIAAKSDEEGKDRVTLATGVTMADAATNKKQVRSVLGTHTGDIVVESGKNGVRLYGHSKGQLLQTITFNYSTVPALISAGVLSKVKADFQHSNTAVVTDPTKVMVLASQQVQQLNQQLNRAPQQHIYGYQPDPSMSFGVLRNASSFRQEQFQPRQASLAAPVPQAVISAPMGGLQMITSGGTTHQQNNSMMVQDPAGGVHGGDGGNDPLLWLNRVRGAYGRDNAAASNHHLQQQQQQQQQQQPGGNGYHRHHQFYPQNYWNLQQYGGGGGHGRGSGHRNEAGDGQQQGHGGGGYL